MTSTLTAPPTKRRGITEDKKAELDALAMQVLDATQDVEQYQAIVNSLTDKLNNFQGFLATAESVRASTLANKSLVDQLVKNAADLAVNSGGAAKEMKAAENKTGALAKNVKLVIDKLIYSADVINKLSIGVIRAKALNPLISDDLVSRIGKAGTDANNAVALTLVALQSTFAAQASNIETYQALVLENENAQDFYAMLTGGDSSIQKLLAKAYINAKADYENAKAACDMTDGQLNEAQTKSGRAQVKLKSLQAGLNAASATALAS